MHIKETEPSMIKYPFLKIPSGLTYCNIFYVATLKKLKSKDLILVVFREGSPES